MHLNTVKSRIFDSSQVKSSTCFVTCAWVCCITLWAPSQSWHHSSQRGRIVRECKTQSSPLNARWEEKKEKSKREKRESMKEMGRRRDFSSWRSQKNKIFGLNQVVEAKCGHYHGVNGMQEPEGEKVPRRACFWPRAVGKALLRESSEKHKAWTH